MTRSALRSRRGASVYVAVMGVGTIVAMAAITTSTIGRLALRDNQRQAELTQAELNARSGIEHALNWMNRNADWRTTVVSGVDQPAITLANGKTVWRVTDADGSLQDDARDHAVLRAEGYCGLNDRTVAVIEVDIEPAGRGLECLGSAIHAATAVYLESGSTVEGTGLITSNGAVEATSATCNLEVMAAGAATGSTYSAGSQDAAASVESPGGHVFDWYVMQGTEIQLSELNDVLFSSDKRLETAELGRYLNQFGETNPLGIYWIDCAGTSVRLRWSRGLGTLVLLNAGPSTQVEDVMLYQAEALNYPVLMVQGDLRIDLSGLLTGQTLHEGFGQNYNPTGLPYEGVEDSDDDDQYPARLDGIVYATGVIEVADDSTIHGCLIGNEVVVDANETLTVEHREYAANYPPPGFSAGNGARILPGTWRRVAK